MNVEKFIIEYLQRDYELPQENYHTINFIEEGVIDSFGLLQFILEIEQEYTIEFTEEELVSDSFQEIGKLIQLIEGKLKENE